MSRQEEFLDMARRLTAWVATECPELLPLASRIATALAQRNEPISHSKDFSSVRWHGTIYGFTATQAAVVRVLWRALRRGAPDVRQETLLMDSASESDRLSDVFKGSPAWGTLVVPGLARGTYRLRDSAEIPPRSP